MPARKQCARMVPSTTTTTTTAPLAPLAKTAGNRGTPPPVSAADADDDDDDDDDPMATPLQAAAEPAENTGTPPHVAPKDPPRKRNWSASSATPRRSSRLVQRFEACTPACPPAPRKRAAGDRLVAANEADQRFLDHLPTEVVRQAQWELQVASWNAGNFSSALPSDV